MGILLLDKNANFSGAPVGNAGLYTSVTSGLLSLFETRRNASKARQNSAPASNLEAGIAGGTFNATSMDFTAVGQVTFPTAPVNAGENTVAIILKIKNGGTGSDSPVGSFSGSATTTGAAYFVNYNRRVSFESTAFNSQTSPSTFVANKSAYLDMPADGSLDGTFQMFVATLKSEVGLTLYRPSTGASSTAAMTAGQFAYFSPSAVNFRANGNGTGQQGVAMFAHWNRVLTPSEISTFYAEMRDQYAMLGLTI